MYGWDDDDDEELEYEQTNESRNRRLHLSLMGRPCSERQLPFLEFPPSHQLLFLPSPSLIQSSSSQHQTQHIPTQQTPSAAAVSAS